ncbi:TPA: hypothetical protein N3A33_004935 [Salmonella enterica subsp. salamae serovar 28:r:e,n,z15]|nr:hypothetical protein [Salmonella enterica subsp. salamae serovar 28:r:e,n,z15]
MDEHEVQRRGELQMTDLNMAAVRTWCSDRVNRMLLQHYCCVLEEAMEEDPATWRLVWGRMLAEPSMKVLFSALGTGGRQIKRRGMQGDEYAILVFHYLIHSFRKDTFFISDEMR